MDPFAFQRATRGATRALAAMAGVALALAVAGCTGAGSAGASAAGGSAPRVQGPQGASSSRAPQARAGDPRSGVVPLTGAGAVAFAPSGNTLAWASGRAVRLRDLASGDERVLDAGADVTDLGYSPDGALWVVAGQPALWRDGQRVCVAGDLDADRLLGADAQGAVVAGYQHSDGVGMLRHQAWLDTTCALVRERTDPVSRGVDSAEADPGAPLLRASLAPRASAPAASRGAGIVAESRDGAWQVVEGPSGRVLRAVAPSPR